VLKSIVKNVLVSGIAYAAVSIIGIVVVTFLIRQYGLAGYGFISLTRIFLPTAALALFDFGFGEISTQIVARSRVYNDWNICGRRLRLIFFITIIVGVLVGFMLACSSIWFSHLLDLNESIKPFQQIIWLTSVLMPVFFLSLVFEGIIKGYECFYEVRGIEVVTALIYALFVVCVFKLFPSHKTFICYSLLASQVIRAVISAFVSIRLLLKEPILFGRSEAEDFKFVKYNILLMAQNKALGVAQTQLAPLFVGFSFGPIGLGTFDALSRLPRAVKSVLGLASSTILPLATKLDQLEDNTALSRIGYVGILGVGLLALPPLAAVIVFCEPLLNLWVGPELASLSGWQASLFLVPAFSVILSVGGSALLVRPNVVSAMNRLVFIQIIIHFGIGCFTSVFLRERAFILGQVVSVALTFLPQLRLICGEMNIPSIIYFELIKLALILVLMSILTYFFSPIFTHWSTLLVSMITWVIFAYVLIYFFALSVFNRLAIKRSIQYFSVYCKSKWDRFLSQKFQSWNLW
jgi:O-antigen/teichoic acid export membrane protein